jgi:hypothetical protein
MRLILIVLALFVFALTSSVAEQNSNNEGCWPSTQADIKECKANCNPQAQSYENCKVNCEIMYRNCQRKPGENAEQTRH